MKSGVERTKVLPSFLSSLKAYSQGDSCTVQGIPRMHICHEFHSNVLNHKYQSKDTKDLKSLLANFCAWWKQQLLNIEFWRGCVESKALSKVLKGRLVLLVRSLCFAPFAAWGSTLQHHCILPPAASFALVSQNSPLRSPRSLGGLERRYLFYYHEEGN